MSKNKEVKLHQVTIAYPHVFNAIDYNSDGNFKYSADLIVDLDSANAKALEDAVQEVLKGGWGNKATAIATKMKSNTDKCCYRDGNTKAQEGYVGRKYVKASNKEKPTVVGRDRNVDLKEQDGLIYTGAIVNAIIDVYANTKFDGVFAKLKGVQFVAHGVRLSGGKPATPDDFEDLSVTEDVDTSILD